MSKSCSNLWKRVANSGNCANGKIFKVGRVYTTEYVHAKGYNPPNRWSPISDWIPLDFNTYLKEIEK